MSGIIRATPEELNSVGGQYAVQSQNVEEVIRHLEDMKKHLIDIWEGEARNAFITQYEELKPSFVNMATLLQEVSQQLQSTAKALADADQQIASQIRG
ncbi:WXG100 family type VII secretion target [Metabacillus fastidiosus]|uniref:ESAT-6-like protein n=1 Tax=Metabacillus fastidiosus TaxID=1458 RepID=A0ABU6P0G4_9BACI|nr:WXG100 family type VII secretion target [Metabacillus fastidiosus]MEC2077198.1 WXG100 family type VII secretion target [Metabacillus fastidiosus]MED4402863.1 WXG100 family type VII secretion target [Metabacillus fastidiosus]MED4454348.1 WXG100 family type VII secretion target [Metabacillus fastidiosus]MED4461281.1 WXG100 family type VII secretion target [Metabacillus fastidiosus]MED4533986.1 WXG100 family type VII secretion target [Metabacillus fastidiosus]